VDEKIAFAIGADTFEQYEMDKRYFEFLLSKLDSHPENCLYVDSQETVLANAERQGIRILQVEPHTKARSWTTQLQNLLR
jgi:FMN phosphatase YigB (HAD superfamily)